MAGKDNLSVDIDISVDPHGNEWLLILYPWIWALPGSSKDDKLRLNNDRWSDRFPGQLLGWGIKVISLNK